MLGPLNRMLDTSSLDLSNSLLISGYTLLSFNLDHDRAVLLLQSLQVQLKRYCRYSKI